MAGWHESKHLWPRKKDVINKKNFIPTVKYGGGSLMLWGYFASTGPGALVKVNGIMEFTQNQDILDKIQVASDRRLKAGLARV